MYLNDFDGVSSAAKYLYDWVRNLTKNGSVYGCDVELIIVREVLSLLSSVVGIFKWEVGALVSSHLSVRLGIQSEVATYQLLLGVIGTTVGGDDIVNNYVKRCN